MSKSGTNWEFYSRKSDWKNGLKTLVDWIYWINNLLEEKKQPKNMIKHRDYNMAVTKGHN